MKFFRSPINYPGNKYFLLPKLENYFPKNKNIIFCDVFGGSGTVSFNSQAKKIIYNEKSKEVYEIIKFLYETDQDNILDLVYKIINKYELSKENKKGYLKLREEYNKNKDVVYLYVLTNYAFNNQIRFNSKGEFNTPFGQGKSHFSEYTKNKIIKFKNEISNKDIEFYNLDYQEFIKLMKEKYNKEKIFFYFDPPYLITTGSYNDGKRYESFWNEKEEINLYNLINEFKNNDNINFALSNVVEHKGRLNNILNDWIVKYHFEYLEKDYSNSNYQTSGVSKEVIVYG